MTPRPPRKPKAVAAPAVNADDACATQASAWLDEATEQGQVLRSQRIAREARYERDAERLEREWQIEDAIYAEQIAKQDRKAAMATAAIEAGQSNNVVPLRKGDAA